MARNARIAIISRHPPNGTALAGVRVARFPSLRRVSRHASRTRTRTPARASRPGQLAPLNDAVRLRDRIPGVARSATSRQPPREQHRRDRAREVEAREACARIGIATNRGSARSRRPSRQAAPLRRPNASTASSGGSSRRGDRHRPRRTRGAGRPRSTASSPSTRSTATAKCSPARRADHRGVPRVDACRWSPPLARRSRRPRARRRRGCRGCAGPRAARAGPARAPRSPPVVERRPPRDRHDARRAAPPARPAATSGRSRDARPRAPVAHVRRERAPPSARSASTIRASIASTTSAPKRSACLSA